MDHNNSAAIKTETTANDVDKNVAVEVINRKILIKMPKNEADINFIRLLKYSRWLNKEYLWQIPDYPGNIELIKDHFGSRINTLNIHDTIEIPSIVGSQKSISRNEVLLLKTRSGRVYPVGLKKYSYVLLRLHIA